MKSLIYTILLFLINIVLSQEVSFNHSSGDWGNNSSWVGGWTDNTPAFLNLPESAGDITINGDIRVGDPLTSQNLTFATNSDVYDFIVNDTLIVYGDVDFANKAMNLVLGNGAVFIIMGNLDMNNKINIASNGTLVVSGSFNKNGSQGSYTGSGDVYAGSFSGNAESTIDSNGSDNSFTIDQLSDNGYQDIEEFVTGGGTSPLPVELLFFDVTFIDNVILSWATSSEVNNDYFSVERSDNGKHFYEIAKIDGHGDTNEEIHYSFVDKFVFSSTAYYRLKQVDFDGQFEYLEIKMISTNRENNDLQINSYPTIVRNQMLHIASSKPIEIIELEAFSLEGRESKNLNKFIIKKNQLNYDIDLEGLSKGIHILELVTSKGNRIQSRIIVE